MARHIKHDDEEFDSNKHREANKAKIEAANKEDAENLEIANFSGPIRHGETRDELLERIRKMREAPPPEPPAEVQRSPSIQKEYDLEVEAGRAAVAKHTAATEHMQALRREHEAEGEKKVG